MGLPNINIAFKTQAVTAINRSEKGIVAVILKDATNNGALVMTNAQQIPANLTAANQAYLSRAFIGGVNPPKKVIAYVLESDASDLSDALAYFATQKFDYLVAPPTVTENEAQAVVTWVKSMRSSDFTPKAVLAETVADHEGIINFSASNIQVGSDTFTAAEYCSRIAGLIAGTPMTIACTYAVLPEVNDIKRLNKTEMDAAIDAGKLVLMHDGEKVKIARGVNSLTTTTQEKGTAFQKIKMVEAIDLMKSDIQATAQDNYIGKYANSYDSKCLLISAIKGYFKQLEQDGILQAGSSEVGIDMAAQEAYLLSTGVDVGEMSEQEIKEANTADQVFLSASVKILDAIEDIDLNIVI